MLSNDQEPIVIELDLKKLMIDNFVITSGLVILFVAIQYICFKDFHFSFWNMIGGTALFVVLYIFFYYPTRGFSFNWFYDFWQSPL